jgi:hypothetical protein
MDWWLVDHNKNLDIGTELYFNLINPVGLSGELLLLLYLVLGIIFLVAGVAG